MEEKSAKRMEQYRKRHKRHKKEPLPSKEGGGFVFQKTR
jgi:hypothetical protein